MFDARRKSRRQALTAVAAVLVVSSRVSSFVSQSPPSSSVSRQAGHDSSSRQRPGSRQAGFGRHPYSRTSVPSLASVLGYVNDDNFEDFEDFEGWNPQPGTEIGTVTLVGSGPGDPELLTVAALRQLQTADLVIADRLVSKEILSLVGKELRVARKYPGCAETAQREIYRWMREGLSAGKHVVRLKIGDPFIFGRGGEEVLEMRKLGVEPKVVPGISSVFAAPLLGGVPVTHRGVATQVTLGTGYGQDYSRPDICDYHPQKTAVFLMAIGRLEELCEDLVKHGYPVDCPVAIVENASTPRQRLIVGAVDTIVKIGRELDVKAPATIVVGEVVSVLHGRQQGLLSDASEGRDAGANVEEGSRPTKAAGSMAKSKGLAEGVAARRAAPSPVPSMGA